MSSHQPSSQGKKPRSDQVPTPPPRQRGPGGGGPAGALTGLAAVIRAICHGDDGKRFKIETKDGTEYSGQGLSVNEIIQLLEAARGDDPDGKPEPKPRP